MIYRRNTEETNFWAGYADCMLALFMVALLLWILSSGKTAFSEAEHEKKRNALQKQIAELNEDLIKKRNEVKKLEGDLVKLEKAIKDKTDWYAKYVEEKTKLENAQKEFEQRLADLNRDLEQLKKKNQSVAELLEKNNALTKEIENLKKMIAGLRAKITGLDTEIAGLDTENARLIKENEKVTFEVTGADAFTFDPGAAVISDEFEKHLWQGADGKGGEFYNLALKIIKRRNDGFVGKVDILEIIGHTDGTRWGGGSGNLDVKLPEFLAGKDPNISRLKAGSNNDLGLLRALAIRQSWGKFVARWRGTKVEQGVLADVEVRCYSAGQTQPTGKALNLKDSEVYKQDNNALRRIEMRLTNRDK